MFYIFYRFYTVFYISYIFSDSAYISPRGPGPGRAWAQHAGLVEGEKHTGFNPKHTGLDPTEHTGFNPKHTGLDPTEHTGLDPKHTGLDPNIFTFFGMEGIVTLEEHDLYYYDSIDVEAKSLSSRF